MLEHLRSKICGYDGSEVKVCCPGYDQRRRRDSFRYDATTEEPWIWDVEETTTPSSYHPINLNNRFGSVENSDFHNFLQPTKTEFGDVDSAFNEFHHFKRKTPKPFRKHEILFHFEDPATYKNCPPAISNEFELPDDFKHIVPPVDRPLPALPFTPPQSPEWNNKDDQMLTRDDKMKLVNTEYCGISVNTRIIGGEDAGPGQFPWMARLAYRNKSKFVCLDNFNFKNFSRNVSIETKIIFRQHRSLNFSQSTSPCHCRSNAFLSFSRYFPSTFDGCCWRCGIRIFCLFERHFWCVVVPFFTIFLFERYGVVV